MKNSILPALVVFATALTGCFPNLSLPDATTGVDTVIPIDTVVIAPPTNTIAKPGANEAREAPAIAAKLGVNFTWAADDMIDGDPTLADGAFQHARFFMMLEKDYNGQQPSALGLQPCTDLENPWSCAPNSPRQHLLRVKELRSMFPHGKVWLAPEVLAERSWPCKGFNVAELGDAEAAGYNWASACLATFGPLGNVILATDNEEWCAEPGRAEAYNQWRRGVIRAHRENPICELAIGARHVRQRKYQGKVLPDRVFDVAPDVWSYLNEVGGWADFHAHGIENGNFLGHDDAHTAEDYRDFFSWSKWLDENYPNIRKAVGEIAYTSSPSGVVPSDDAKRADWPTYRSLVEGIAAEADQVYLYQIEEQPYPEGVFSGSGVYPALIDSVRALAGGS